MIRLFTLTLALLAVSEGFANPATPANVEKNDTRLSWGPYEYLKKGYRNAPWVNDPFYPEGRAFQLMGMISNEMAYINGQWFRLGDTVAGFTIKSIKPEGVTLTKRSEIMLIKIKD